MSAIRLQEIMGKQPAPDFSNSRLCREFKTIHAMIAIYCRQQHRQKKGLCTDCSNLLKYAGRRLESCPFSKEKPTCGRCLIHCYSKEKRQQVKKIMRYSGPRMLHKHPILAAMHLFDEKIRKPQEKESISLSNTR